MANKYGFSDLECKIILDQIERRAKLRKEFLKQRTDPCKHANEAGYVFDKAIQNWYSMKVTTLDHFPFNFRTIRFAVMSILIPMGSFGYLLWSTRTKKERERRCGRLKYGDRPWKLA
ncbi:unnamed protein product [Chrysodeixis includens]|uniref:NADH dehydrogenase [ubiquinone] 1 beta subcomplex subunit 4 n=1 Tax=Chrysodeixis includens TaxID=689277 RepID=A0A9N8Q0I4_CHRIL|nr:unnamed protein product [Chrysodeixis includens]